ncbi:MAG TPA: DUF1579 family protein [Candidatus Binatia bacterium]
MALLPLLLGVLVATLACADDFERRAEDAVLARFLGTWRTETTVRDGAGNVIAHTLGTARAERTLEGRWVEFRSASIPPGAAELQIMTREPATGVLRQWLFDSDGYWHTAEGSWHPASETITWRGEKDGASFVIEDRWRSPDRLEWTLVRKDGDGRTVRTIDGTLTRAE